MKQIFGHINNGVYLNLSTYYCIIRTPESGSLVLLLTNWVWMETLKSYNPHITYVINRPLQKRIQQIIGKLVLILRIQI